MRLCSCGFSGQTAKLVFQAFDLAPGGFALLASISAAAGPTGTPPAPGGAVHNRCRHLQIAQEFGGALP